MLEAPGEKMANNLGHKRKLQRRQHQQGGKGLRLLAKRRGKGIQDRGHSVFKTATWLRVVVSVGRGQNFPYSQVSFE